MTMAACHRARWDRTGRRPPNGAHEARPDEEHDSKQNLPLYQRSDHKRILRLVSSNAGLHRLAADVSLANLEDSMARISGTG
jgi:hypothetical protein